MYFHPNKQTLNTTSAVALAQAKKSSLGESLSRSGESVSPRRDTNSGKRENQGELSLRLGWFAQTRSLSRSSDPNSPRRDFAQEQRCVFWCFRSGECHSPRRKYQVTNLFLHAMSQYFSITNNKSSDHAIQYYIHQSNMQFKLIYRFPIRIKEIG